MTIEAGAHDSADLTTAPSIAPDIERESNMRAISEQRLHTDRRPRSTPRSALWRAIGLGLLGAALLIGTTAGADPRKATMRSSSSTTLWFGRSAEVVDAITAWKRNRTDEAVVEALHALKGQLHRSDYQVAASIVCMGKTAQGQA